jgi:hypothetical protein
MRMRLVSTLALMIAGLVAAVGLFGPETMAQSSAPRPLVTPADAGRQSCRIGDVGAKTTRWAP